MHDLWSGRTGADGEEEEEEGAGEATGGSGADAAALAAAGRRYLPYSRLRREQLRGLVERFLTAGGGDEGGGGGGADDVAALEVNSMRRLRQVLQACRVR